MVRREDVFINVPFDDHFQPLFLALVTGIVAHGGTPRCVLELPADKNRLARLTKLIRNSGSSFHDLSRINRTRTKAHGLVPRFNMPFELGLAVMASPQSFFVLEEKPYRLQATLSDLNGYDPLIHKGDPVTLLEKMRDALRSPRHRPSHQQLLDVYRRVEASVQAALAPPAEFFSRVSFFTIVTFATDECTRAGLLAP